MDGHFVWDTRYSLFHNVKKNLKISNLENISNKELKTILISVNKMVLQLKMTINLFIKQIVVRLQTIDCNPASCGSDTCVTGASFIY